MTRNLFCLLAAALLALSSCKKVDEAPPAPSVPPPPAPPPHVLEHEPNDVQHAQAIPPRAIVLGEITPGKKNAPDDDWYRVSAGAGTLLALHIELSGAEPVASAAPRPVLGPLDVQLEIDDRDRNRLVLVRATSGEPALLPAVACFESCYVHIWGSAPAAYQLTVLGAPPQEGEELEPNDRAIDATPLSAGKSVQGTIATPDDEDWFKLTAQARPGQFLRVELSGVPGVRPEMELRALSDGALLATFRAAAEGEGIFLRDLSLNGDIPPPEPPNLRQPAPGADGGAVDGGVAELASLPDAGANSALPIDNAGADAGATTANEAPSAGPAKENPPAQSPIAAGEDAGESSDTDAGDPADAAPTVPAPGNAASASIVGTPTIDAGPPAKAEAIATTASGSTTTAPAPSAPAATAPDAGVDAGNALAAAIPAIPQGYYLVIRSSPLTNEKKAPRGANQRAPYTLATALEAGPGDLEVEPNDDPQHTTWISTTRTGYLAPMGDMDWYRVRNEGKSVLRAEVTGLNRADLELSVYLPPAHPGDKPALLARANEGGVREGETLPAVGIDGDALVLVQCAPRDLDGVKVRDCEDRDAPYTLSVNLVDDDGALEREPNDDLEHAQQIAIPAKVTGTLWPKRDVDQFRFQLEAPRTLSFRLSALRGVDTMLTLRELKTGKRRTTAEVIGTADASRGEGREEILAVPLKAGSYTIEVASPRRDGSATQSYVLTVQ